MKLAIITGGSKGLGKALISQLDNTQWEVFELSRSGSTKKNIRCDFSNPKSVHEICKSLFESLVSNNWYEVLLISNAADIQPIKFVSNLDYHEIENNLAINQTSAFIIISEFIKTFQNHCASKVIINISSGAAHKGYPGWSLYCASKAATENFINSIAIEQESEKHPFVSINYNPGIIDTDMQKGIRNTDFENFPLRERFILYKEKGDLRTPEYVAVDLIKKFSENLQSGKSYSVKD